MATNIFNLIGTDYFGDFFRENLNAWVQNYGFKYYLRQKTQAEAKENKIIAQFIGVLLCFQPWFLWKPEHYSIHYRKNIPRRKVRKLLASDEIFCRRNFPRTKFLRFLLVPTYTRWSFFPDCSSGFWIYLQAFRGSWQLKAGLPRGRWINFSLF